MATSDSDEEPITAEFSTREYLPDEEWKPVCIVSRKEWGAVPPREAGLDRLKRPVDVVGITYTTETLECTNRGECIERLQFIQKRDMDKGLPDLPFSFLVGGDGCMYEGRGWKYKPYRSLINPDAADKCIDIGFIGNFEKPKGTPVDMFTVASTFTRIGVQKKVLDALFTYRAFDTYPRF